MRETKLYHDFVDNLPDLVGQSVVITGTTSGIGYHTAKATIKKGATVLFVVNRASERSQKCLEDLEAYKTELESKTELFKVDCDFTDLSTVEKAGKTLNELCEDFGGINVLANNAGVMGFPDKRTKDGYDVQMQINHLGQYLLTKLILPSLKRKHDAKEEVRIVQHSSLARRDFGKMLDTDYFRKSEVNTLGGHGLAACLSRYHQTKLANAAFAMALARRLTDNEDIDASIFKSVVAEPGLSDTNIGPSLVKSHKGLGTCHNVGFMFDTGLFILKFRRFTVQSDEDGSLCLLQAMFGENVENGDFFMPESNTAGSPLKEISNGKLTANALHKESYTLDKKNQDLVWNCSEEELGAFFEFI